MAFTHYSLSSSSHRRPLWLVVLLVACVGQFVWGADRKDGAGNAAGLAAMGAAAAGASCAMLMKAAEEEEDPSMKAMLRSQAMQQCMQAAQSAANAAKNNDGKEKMSSTNEPKTESIAKDTETPTTPNPTTPTNPDVALPDGGTRDETLPPNPQLADEKPVDPGVFQPPGKLNTVEFNDDAPKNTMTQLKPIDREGVGFDDSKSGTGTPTAPNTGLGFGGFGMGYGQNQNKNDSDLLKLASDLNEGAEPGRKKRGDQGAEGGAGSGSGGEDSHANSKSGNGGDDGFASMLNQFMGGGPKAELATAGPEYFDNGTRSGAAAGKKAPNIFEYASYRYRRASNEGVVAKVSTRSDRMPASITGGAKR